MSVKAPNKTKSKIMQYALKHIRTAGVQGFSFRQLADEIGIKSASVHYHFPTKSDLIFAVAQEYRRNYTDWLGEPKLDNTPPKENLQRYICGFRTEMLEVKQMCLFGMLGHSRELLDEKTESEVDLFFAFNKAWLAKVIGQVYEERSEKPPTKKKIEQMAMFMHSVMDGALFISRSVKDDDYFEGAIVPLTNWIENL